MSDKNWEIEDDEEVGTVEAWGTPPPESPQEQHDAEEDMCRGQSLGDREEGYPDGNSDNWKMKEEDVAGSVRAWGTPPPESPQEQHDAEEDMCSEQSLGDRDKGCPEGNSDHWKMEDEEEVGLVRAWGAPPPRSHQEQHDAEEDMCSGQSLGDREKGCPDGNSDNWKMEEEDVEGSVRAWGTPPPGSPQGQHDAEENMCSGQSLEDREKGYPDGNSDNWKMEDEDVAGSGRACGTPPGSPQGQHDAEEDMCSEQSLGDREKGCPEGNSDHWKMEDEEEVGSVRGWGAPPPRSPQEQHDAEEDMCSRQSFGDREKGYPDGSIDNWKMEEEDVESSVRAWGAPPPGSPQKQDDAEKDMHRGQSFGDRGKRCPDGNSDNWKMDEEDVAGSVRACGTPLPGSPQGQHDAEEDMCSRQSFGYREKIYPDENIDNWKMEEEDVAGSVRAWGAPPPGSPQKQDDAEKDMHCGQSFGDRGKRFPDGNSDNWKMEDEEEMGSGRAWGASPRGSPQKQHDAEKYMHRGQSVEFTEKGYRPGKSDNWTMGGHDEVGSVRAWEAPPPGYLQKQHSAEKNMYSGQSMRGRKQGYSDGKSGNPMNRLRLMASKPLKEEKRKRMFIQEAWKACHGGMETDLLHFLLQGGMECVFELCSSEFPISTKAGIQQHLVSFQRVTVPFTRFLICDVLRKTPLSIMYNKVLSNCLAHMDIPAYAKAVEDLVKRRSIDDPLFKEPPGMVTNSWVPKNPFELLRPVTTLLFMLLVRFGTSQPGIVEEIRKSIGPMKTYLEVFGSDRHVKKDALSELEQNINKLESQINFKQDKYERGLQILRQNEIGRELQVQENSLYPQNEGEMSAPPGSLNPDGPRHANDHVNIMDIAIVPTPEEVLCPSAPFLPKNRAGDPSYPIKESAAAHKDMHFRLLRHDLIGQLCQSVHRFWKSGGVKSLQGEQLNFHSNETGEQRGKSAYQAHMLIYRNAKIVSFAATRRAGVHYMIEFDELPWLRRMKRKARELWWGRSRRLQQGTLVCLWSDANQQPKLYFGVITVRLVENLAPVRDHRPMIGIRLAISDNEYNKTFIEACISKDAVAGGEIILIQAGPSFFAYEPILKALRETHLPFCNYLTKHAEKGLPSHTLISPPAYMQDRDGIGRNFDFSCVLSPIQNIPSSESRSRLEAANITRHGQKIADCLRRESSLDQAQAEALVMGLTRELALIQGPPGTGKTFLGIQLVKLLIANVLSNPSAVEAQILPILCVCYTNHALDQFLKGILDSGITELVRVGGRCLCEEVDAHNLRPQIHKQAAYIERNLLRDAKSKLDRLESTIRDLGVQLKRISTARWLEWADVEDVLDIEVPHFEQSLHALAETTDFQRSSSNKLVADLWKQWGSQQPSDLQLQLVVSQRTMQTILPTGDSSHAQRDTQHRPGSFWRRPPLQSTGAYGGGGSSSANDPRQEQQVSYPLSELTVFNLDKISTSQFAELDRRDRTLEELLECQEVWLMSRREKRKIHDNCKEEIVGPLMDQLIERMNAYGEIKKEIDELEDKVSLGILRASQIVGMTTSGVASHQNLVAALAPKVVIVEEAAEVLEAHILTSLSDATQHLILIGDHEQLRPKTDSFELRVESGKGFNLDLSLFERLIRTLDFPCATLQTQRRMRPSFSRLIREAIYPKLLDHDNVKKYPDVPGVTQNLFFLDHDHPECGGDEESKSKYNLFEAEFAVTFARYLMQQNAYTTDDITIITPYVGQLLKLKKEAANSSMQVILNEKDEEQVVAMEEATSIENHETSIKKAIKQAAVDKDAWGIPTRDMSLNQHSAGEVTKNVQDYVRIATIDNFQGEESKVVILSLVRNMQQGKIGFLAIQNRINVLLSRAQHGMFILGNAESLRESKSKMWLRVLEMLEETGSIGPEIELVCQNHRERVTPVSEPRDFRHVQDGGCTINCMTRLECGHQCPRMCHPDDRDHLLVQCQEPCKRGLDPCGHSCDKLCWQPCGPCTKVIDRVPLPCGHEMENVPCHIAQMSGQIQCRELVELQVTGCGHKHSVECHEKDRFMRNPKCRIQVEVDMPVCKHRIKVECCQRDETVKNATRCTAVCRCTMACGHDCSSTCGQCIKKTMMRFNDLDMQNMHGVLRPRDEWKARILHPSCTELCGRNMFCGHRCRAPCHGEMPCPPCKHDSTIKCEHSQCDSKCGEPSSACPSPCGWACEHRGRCHLLCGAPCNRLPCDLQCSKRLPCSCRCPCLCGEKCPSSDFCLQHAREAVKTQVVDLVELQKFGDLTKEDVEQDPLIVLDCGHVFTTSTLDGYMGLESVYLKRDGRWVQPLGISNDFQPRRLCPTCRRPVRDIRRYGRILNKYTMDLTELTFMGSCRQQLIKGGENVKEAEHYGEQAHKEGPSEETIRMKLCHKAKNLANEAHTNFDTIIHKFARHPRLDLYQRTRASLLDQEEVSDEQVIQHLQLLGVPKPDTTLLCKAHVGVGLSAKAWLVASAGLLSSIPSSTGRLEDGIQQLLINESKNSEYVYKSGKKYLEEGIEHAAKIESRTTQLHGIQALMQLLLQMAQHLGQRANNPLPIHAHTLQPAEDSTNIPERQRSLLRNAEAYGHRALYALQDCRSQGMHLPWIQKQTQAINTLLEEIGNSMEAVHIDKNIEVVWAVLKADPNIVENTYGHGHIYRCPRGHVYIIGECGQAMETSRCLECGSTIGGHDHRLARHNLGDNGIAEEIRRNWT